MSSKETISLFSPCKINVGLAVRGRRPDGYHLIQSVFLPLNFGDSISIWRSEKVAVSMGSENVEGLDRISTTENLVFRVLDRFTREGGQSFEAKIFKKIPLGGGLGGGSSNAGTVLRFLVSRGYVTEQDAFSWAKQLGADIPFFLNPVPSWVEGIGEAIQAVGATGENVPGYFLLVFPKEGCATREVFQNFAPAEAITKAWQQLNPRAVDVWTNGTFLKLYQTAHNDLTAAAIRSCPAISRTLNALKKTSPWTALMSGSGSTCFAVYPTREALLIATKELSAFFRIEGCRYSLATGFGSADTTGLQFEEFHHGNHRS